jgi:iron(III) transport system substrate-binding protein
MRQVQAQVSRRTMMAMAGAGLAVAGRVRAADRHLVMYSANDDTVNGIVTKAFAKATGIKVDVVSTGSGVLFRRIGSEQARPQADVIWGVSAALLKQNKKYFEPYAAKEGDKVPAEYRGSDNLWLGTNLQILTISQNTKSIPADQGPRSWDDLINPKWKGKIAYTDPANSGSSYATATLLLSMWGNNDAAWEKLSKLIANTKVLNRSTLVFDGNGTGEYPLGISLEYAGYLWAHNGAPVKVIYPSDGTTALAEGVAIIKGGPNPETARTFVDFLNSKGLQEELLRTTFRRPARQDIDLTAVPAMPPLSKLKLLPYDDAKWDAVRRETLNHLRTVIQNTR